MVPIVSTEYVYTDNGVDYNGNDANSNTFGWMSWDRASWTITFPTPIQKVLGVDFTTMSGVTLKNTTSRYDGSLRLFAYDEHGALVGSRTSATINRLSEVPVSNIGVLELDGDTVKTIKIMGPSNQGPNIALMGVVKNVTTYTIVTEEDEFIEPLTQASSSISFQVHGNQTSTYDVVVDNRTISDVKPGETINVAGLNQGTTYTISLMGQVEETIPLTKTIIVRNYQSNPLTIAEVQVFNTSGYNVAINGTATQSSTAWGGVATRGIDGNASGWYSHNGMTHTSPDYDQWWRLELATPTEIDRVVVMNRTEAGLGSRLSGATIEIYDQNGNVQKTGTLGSQQTQTIRIV